jgi:hypothetical protein
MGGAVGKIMTMMMEQAKEGTGPFAGKGGRASFTTEPYSSADVP